MLPHDTNDLIIAIILFALFVSTGFIMDKTSFFKQSEALERVSINDDLDLFLLNYLKTETENGRISDLVLEAENDESKFEILKDETENIMDFGLAGSYDIRISYPSAERRINNDDIEELKEIKLPTRNGNVLLIRGGFIFREG